MLHVAINCIVVQLFWWFETLCSLVGLFKPGGLDSKGSFLYYSTKGQQLILITLQMLSSNQSNPIQFWSGLILINWGGQIYPTITAISPTPTLHLALFMASFFSKPTLLLSFSTCVFHVFFGHSCFLLPFTSNSIAFLKTCPSSLLNTCPYHRYILYMIISM